MASGLTELVGLPLALLAATRAATRLLGRADEIEEALAGGGRHVTKTLDEILDKLAPVREELNGLRTVATSLETELKASREALAGLAVRIAELEKTAARLEGSLEHVFDKVPGMSVEDARERSEEVAAAT
jgi:septal ring factor EnvC (AmiA/AmiB activator)